MSAPPSAPPALSTGRAALYAACVGAVGLGVRSLVAGPVPFSLAVAAFGGFGAVVMAGVLEPRLSMYGDVVNRGEPLPEAPRVALTFDDGPSVTITPRLLDVLDRGRVQATFFTVGRKLDTERKGIARDALARGHGLGCHSFEHDRFFALRGAQRVRDDLRRGLEAIEDAVGKRTTLFRPPVGHTNPIIARVASELGLRLIGFSVRGYDGLVTARAAPVARRVMRGLEDGAIVLLHDAAERDDFTPPTLEVVPRVLDVMTKRGLRGVDLETLLNPGREAPGATEQEIPRSSAGK